MTILLGVPFANLIGVSGKEETRRMLVRRSAEAARCLQQAEECEVAAESATDPAAKRSFLDVAERWRRIAETREHIDRVNRSLRKTSG